MEDWPFWKLSAESWMALGGDRSRTILTICPHCGLDRHPVRGRRPRVPGGPVSRRLPRRAVRDGKLTVEKKAESRPCIIHAR